MRTLFVSALILLTALSAFGHAGEVHKYMGTVASVRDDGSFQLRRTDGQSLRIGVGKSTVYRHADGHAARRADVVVGKRVVVTVSTDGRTATEVKLGARKR